MSRLFRLLPDQRSAIEEKLIEALASPDKHISSAAVHGLEEILSDTKNAPHFSQICQRILNQSFPDKRSSALTSLLEQAEQISKLLIRPYEYRELHNNLKGNSEAIKMETLRRIWFSLCQTGDIPELMADVEEISVADDKPGNLALQIMLLEAAKKKDFGKLLSFFELEDDAWFCRLLAALEPAAASCELTPLVPLLGLLCLKQGSPARPARQLISLMLITGHNDMAVALPLIEQELLSSDPGIREQAEKDLKLLRLWSG